MSDDTNQDTPQGDQNQNDIENMIANVDLEKVTKDDVFTDIIQASKLFAFRLMVGAALLERLIVKGKDNESQDSTEEKPAE